MLIPLRYVRCLCAAAAAWALMAVVPRPKVDDGPRLEEHKADGPDGPLERAHRMRRAGEPARAAYARAALRTELPRADRERAAYWRAALALRAGERAARAELLALVDDAQDVDLRLRAASLLVTHASDTNDARAIVERLERSIAAAIEVRTKHGARWRRAFTRVVQRAATRE